MAKYTTIKGNAKAEVIEISRWKAGGYITDVATKYPKNDPYNSNTYKSYTGGLYKVQAGKGNDVITLAGVGTNVRSGQKIYGEAGKDAIRLTDNAGNSHYINGGAGNDTIDINSGNKHTVYGGDGNDTIEVAVHVDRVDWYMGGGASYVQSTPVKKVSGIKAYGGNDADTIHIGFDKNTRVDGGNQSDKLIAIKSNASYLYGGSGNDKIAVLDSKNMTVDGNAGKDYIYINGTSTGKFSGGSGSDYIGASENTKSATMAGGAGNDTYEIARTLSGKAKIVIDQTTAGKKDVDKLKIAGSSKDFVKLFKYSSGNMILYAQSGATVTIKGWKKAALAEIDFLGKEKLTKKQINELAGISVSAPGKVSAVRMEALKAAEIDFPNSAVVGSTKLDVLGSEDKQKVQIVATKG